MDRLTVLVQNRDVDSDAGVVERYLSCLAAHDWEGLAATLADQGFARDGPFRDLVEGKEPYVAFLRGVVTSLKGHELTVQRVSHASDRVSYVELTETVEADGVATAYPECIVFERDEGGLIRHVSVFMQWAGSHAPRGGGDAP